MSGWNLPPGVSDADIERVARCCGCDCETCRCPEDDEGLTTCDCCECEDDGAGDWEYDRMKDDALEA